MMKPPSLPSKRGATQIYFHTKGSEYRREYDLIIELLDDNDGKKQQEKQQSLAAVFRVVEALVDSGGAEGDTVMMANDEPLAGKSLDEMISILRSPTTTSLLLLHRSPDSWQRLRLELAPPPPPSSPSSSSAAIPPNALEEFEMVDENTTGDSVHSERWQRKLVRKEYSNGNNKTAVGNGKKTPSATAEMSGSLLKDNTSSSDLLAQSCFSTVSAPDSEEKEEGGGAGDELEVVIGEDVLAVVDADGFCASCSSQRSATNQWQTMRFDACDDGDAERGTDDVDGAKSNENGNMVRPRNANGKTLDGATPTTTTTTGTNGFPPATVSSNGRRGSSASDSSSSGMATSSLLNSNGVGLLGGVTAEEIFGALSPLIGETWKLTVSPIRISYCGNHSMDGHLLVSNYRVGIVSQDVISSRRAVATAKAEKFAKKMDEMISRGEDISGVSSNNNNISNNNVSEEGQTPQDVVSDGEGSAAPPPPKPTASNNGEEQGDDDTPSPSSFPFPPPLQAAAAILLSHPPNSSLVGNGGSREGEGEEPDSTSLPSPFCPVRQAESFARYSSSTAGATLSAAAAAGEDGEGRGGGNGGGGGGNGGGGGGGGNAYGGGLNTRRRYASHNTLGEGLVRGVTGLFTQPIAGAVENGFGGFVRGVGKGLFGMAVKPMTSMMFRSTSSGSSSSNSNNNNYNNYSSTAITNGETDGGSTPVSNNNNNGNNNNNNNTTATFSSTNPATRKLTPAAVILQDSNSGPRSAATSTSAGGGGSSSTTNTSSTVASSTTNNREISNNNNNNNNNSAATASLSSSSMISNESSAPSSVPTRGLGVIATRWHHCRPILSLPLMAIEYVERVETSSTLAPKLLIQGKDTRFAFIETLSNTEMRDQNSWARCVIPGDGVTAMIKTILPLIRPPSIDQIYAFHVPTPLGQHPEGWKMFTLAEYERMGIPVENVLDHLLKKAQGRRDRGSSSTSREDDDGDEQGGRLRALSIGSSMDEVLLQHLTDDDLGITSGNELDGGSNNNGSNNGDGAEGGNATSRSNASNHMNGNSTPCSLTHSPVPVSFSSPPGPQCLPAPPQKSLWRMSLMNESFLQVPTYPQFLAVPAKVSDTILFQSKEFRTKGRFPVLTWKRKENDEGMLNRRRRREGVICRSSQPRFGLLRKRSFFDEELVKCIAIASDNLPMVVVDCRPLSSAMANEAMGAGYEEKEHYPEVEVSFMEIDNMHEVRKSYEKVRSLSERRGEMEDSWLVMLHSTRWMSHISKVVRAAAIVVEIVEGGTSVLIHCSDGWDRTPQVASLAQLCLDPFYRTRAGFIVLIEKDWLEFGHRFGERCGFDSTQKSATDRYSLVFIQFLDCVFQLIQQAPTSFEYGEDWLLLLVDLMFSGRFGTFLCNSVAERLQNELPYRSESLWPIMLRSNLSNPDYVPFEGVIHPVFHVGALRFWSGFFFRHNSLLCSSKELLNDEIFFGTEITTVPPPSPPKISLEPVLL